MPPDSTGVPPVKGLAVIDRGIELLTRTSSQKITAHFER
jgi:hypothetical protein